MTPAAELQLMMRGRDHMRPGLGILLKLTATTSALVWGESLMNVGPVGSEAGNVGESGTTEAALTGQHVRCCLGQRVRCCLGRIFRHRRLGRSLIYVDRRL